MSPSASCSTRQTYGPGGLPDFTGCSADLSFMQSPKGSGGFGRSFALHTRAAPTGPPTAPGNCRAYRHPATTALTQTGALPYNSPMAFPPRKSNVPPWPSGLAPKSGGPARTNPAAREDQFRELQASLLYCPRCRVATPTRERLLLVLPTGNLYEYLCQQCGASTGSKTEHG